HALGAIDTRRTYLRPRRHAAGGKFVAYRLRPRHGGLVGHERHRGGPARNMAGGAVVPQARKHIAVVIVFGGHWRVRSGVQGGREEKDNRERDYDARSNRVPEFSTGFHKPTQYRQLPPRNRDIEESVARYCH